MFGLNASSQKQAKKTLVAYFSATGTTKAVAEQLKAAAGADLYEITPVEPYTDADLDWRNKQSRSSLEMKDKTSRPAIAGKLKNMKDYNVVYVGFPIWWNTCPTIINTFMETKGRRSFPLLPVAAAASSSLVKT